MMMIHKRSADASWWLWQVTVMMKWLVEPKEADPAAAFASISRFALAFDKAILPFL